MLTSLKMVLRALHIFKKMKTTLNKYDKFKVDIYNYFIIC